MIENSQNLSSSMPEAEAEKQQEAIRKIMADTGMVFGDAVNVYIKQHKKPTIILAGDHGLAASHRPLFDRGDGWA